MSHERGLDNPIPISWLCRDDLINCRPDLEERIKALAQEDVEHIANKVGDALQETYWLATNIILDDFFTKNE